MTTLKDALLIVSEKHQQHILILRTQLINECPTAMKALRLLDYEYSTPKQHKGYNLLKRENKKLTFVYYVRYWHENKMIPSKWCTHTNDYLKACLFAVQNREKLITNYLNKTDNKLLLFFKSFYNENNPIFKIESKRNENISDSRRKRYYSIVNNKFIPFLKNQNINNYKNITVKVLNDFQDYLLSKGMKAQSVNYDMIGINKIFKYLLRKGLIEYNPFASLLPVRVNNKDRTTHGCFEINKLNGVFNNNWNTKKDNTSFILNLIIYSTGMRNIEIKKLTLSNINTISGIHFINVLDSKTENGIRLIPLHDYVYKEI
jgi:integrase